MTTRQVPLSRPLKRFTHLQKYDKKLRLSNDASTTSLAHNKSKALPTFGGLTLDVWNIVFTYLQPPDLRDLALVNSLFHVTVTSSPTWRFYKSLFPTSRKIWALSWEEGYNGYFARTIPLTGAETVTYNLSVENLPADQPFASLFLNTDRRVIEFFGPSVRHRHDTFLTQADGDFRQLCQSWKITSTPQYSMGQVKSLEKVVVELPPRGHHLRPAGLDVVGTFLFWVDFEDNPIGFEVTAEGLTFDDELGEMALWPDGAFEEQGDDLCLLHRLFLSWGESQFEFSGQMCCATPSVRLNRRKQTLRLYDYQKNKAYTIPFDELLKEKGPWKGGWRSPWLHPWGFDDDGNLLFKIIDTKLVDGGERLRVVQTSYHLESMRTTFSHEILEDIQLPSPWNFQLFSDQCWGYPIKDVDGNIWCILRDLRDGNIVRRVGPLNRIGTHPYDYACHISMFHVLFQDKSQRFSAANTPAHTPLRIFPIDPIPPDIQHRYPFSEPMAAPQTSQLLYELHPPYHPDPPGFWTFGGEDAAERYLFFQGATINSEDGVHSDDWKKWVVWDSHRREWTMLKCQRDWGINGFYCLFSQVEGNKERVGLQWVTME